MAETSKITITERQARDLCDELGIDPDAKIWVVVNHSPAGLCERQVALALPAWRHLQAELENLDG